MSLERDEALSLLQRSKVGSHERGWSLYVTGEELLVIERALSLGQAPVGAYREEPEPAKTTAPVGRV